MSALVRLNINVNADTASVFNRITTDKGITYTEAVRRALSVYAYINSEVSQGRRLLTTDPDGTNKREVVLL